MFSAFATDCLAGDDCPVLPVLKRGCEMVSKCASASTALEVKLSVLAEEEEEEEEESGRGLYEAIVNGDDDALVVL